MIEFKLPSLGADMTEGKLLAWHVQPGDSVKRGQVVAVVDTSKAAIDVEIWQDGVVHELLVPVGDKVPVGTVLATLLAPGETPQQASPEVLAVATQASPARPGGDVATAAEGKMAPAPSQRQQDMRQAIAAAMSRSKREIPHYYLAETISVQVAMDWLQQHNAGLPITERLLPAVLLLKAVAVALKNRPELNGVYLDGQFHPSAAVHAGVAISLRGGGLVAPAIHDVQRKSLEQLMHDLSDLVKRARAGSLRSSEISDATITVTNLGEQAIGSVFGVIYPPQVALVGFGGIVARPWVVDGVVCAQPVLCATLAADHRVSDGHQGALFLAELRDVLQQPHMLAGAVP
ncbi:MAG: dihydrolipoamide acetyltransferase family protein [Rhodoferax sp.]|uniref:dihydrolipoamide acetyltransferase family protein n=1 Tax=Rhodoferax sp. TaxID=50421 RepID=UPI002731B238|nr:dihydrolipoamide acetyltransferase family protein [Rhodoferax sp.]MDP1529779.1 dihydrolipoamide acetyltransferase family protein [Rhodoferax sp.]MDP1942880.1 dihydrolipoamide acetyltransferase family protein [Rhodoferax sp.]